MSDKPAPIQWQDDCLTITLDFKSMLSLFRRMTCRSSVLKKPSSHSAFDALRSARQEVSEQA